MQVGINPRMTAASGVFDILGPEVLITLCSGTLLFNYRTNGIGVIVAELLLVDDAEVLGDQPIASAYVDAVEPGSFVCLPLVCTDDVQEPLVRIGRVKITAKVRGGLVEVSDVNFQDSTTCDQTTSKRGLHA